MGDTQKALVRRYDFGDAREQSLAVCLRKAADFVEDYEGGIMDLTLTRDAEGPVISLFTDDLPDTEGALVEAAGTLIKHADTGNVPAADYKQLRDALYVAKVARRD